MNFEKALELLKQGKKVRKCSWGKYYYIVFDEDSLLRQKKHGSDYYNKYYILNKNDIDTVWEEYKEPLVTEEEKEYLKMIIKFNLFKVKTVEITRPDPCWDDRHFILLRGYNDDEDDSANFIKPNYFKNLENTKSYTLEELGLEE